MKMMTCCIPMIGDGIGTDDYVISNGSLDDICPEEGDEHSPGIKMFVEECPNLEELFSNFCYEQCGEENPNFLQHYKRTLRGEETPWKLAVVKIRNHFLWMEFVNEGLREAVAFDTAWLKEQGSVILRFELQAPNSDNPEIVCVDFIHKNGTLITEFEKNSKRELLFPGEKVTLENGSSYRFIPVTEYYR